MDGVPLLAADQHLFAVALDGAHDLGRAAPAALVGGVRLLFFREPGAELFASTRSWKVPAEADGAIETLPPDDQLQAAGFEVLGGIDTFWYTWAAVNQGSSILR